LYVHRRELATRAHVSPIKSTHAGACVGGSSAGLTSRYAEHRAQSEGRELRVFGRAQRRNVIESVKRRASFTRPQPARCLNFACVLPAGVGEAIDARE